MNDTTSKGFGNGYIYSVPTLFESRKQKAILKYMLSIGEKHQGFNITKTDANVVLSSHFLEKLSYAFFTL